MIYCVVPPELGEDAYQRLVQRYEDNPNVTVIWERRRAERRTRGAAPGGARELRDRRRRRLPGDTAV